MAVTITLLYGNDPNFIPKEMESLVALTLLQFSMDKNC